MLAAISAVATLANPFGWRVWTYVLSIPTSSVVTKNIEEWQPTSVLQITGAFFFASVVGVVGLLLWRRRTIAWQETLSLLVFFGAGLVAVRWARWWGIAAPIFLAAILRDVRPRRPELESRNVLNTAIAGALIGAVLLAIPWSLGSSRLPAGPHLAFAPPGITQALEEHLHPGDRIFNAERWGSWLEFAFPQSLVFVDSRIELFPDRVWRDYEGVSDARQGWPAILDRYRIAVIVAHRETQPYLIRAAERDPRWERVYADEDGVVLVRR